MLKKLTGLFQEYFGISKKEARGALVLMALCLFLLWMPFVFRRWILPALPIGQEPVDLKKLDSIAVIIEKEHQAKFKTHKSYPRKAFVKKPAKPIRLFDFDPNSASVNDLETIGIPPFLAKRIDKFRSKGGKFRKKEDLLNIYDFPSELFHKLEDHIVFSEQAKTLKADLKPGNTGGRDKSAYVPKTFKKPIITAFDINKADTTELVRLRGIGSKLSQRILKFRDALGGFHSESQYSEIFGLDSVALSELSRFAKVDSEVKRININIASAEELGRHPYLRNKRINTAIVNYRSQHGPFQTIDDLKKVKVMDEELVKKMKPYLSF